MIIENAKYKCKQVPKTLCDLITQVNTWRTHSVVSLMRLWQEKYVVNLEHGGWFGDCEPMLAKLKTSKSVKPFWYLHGCRNCNNTFAQGPWFCDVGRTEIWTQVVCWIPWRLMIDSCNWSCDIMWHLVICSLNMHFKTECKQALKILFSYTLLGYNMVLSEMKTFMSWFSYVICNHFRHLILAFNMSMPLCHLSIWSSIPGTLISKPDCVNMS